MYLYIVSSLAHVKNTGLRIHTWLIATMDSNSKVMNRPNILKIDLENQGLIYSLEIHRQSERKDEHLTYNLVICTLTFKILYLPIKF